MPAFGSFLRFLRRVPLEAVVWAGALAALAWTDPAGEGLLNLCGFRLLGLPQLLGLEGCPGCGLGHAVAYLLDGQLMPALRTHPLAPFALAMLVGRIAVLVREALRTPVAATA